MSDAQHPAAGAAGRSANLDLMVACAMRVAFERRHGQQAGSVGPDELVIAAAAIDLVCEHLRACGRMGTDADPRLDSAIDDYLSPPASSRIPAATLAQMASVPIEIVDAPEPTAEDTIVARVGADGSYSDVKHAGGR